MCKDDSLCRCDIEEKELKSKIFRAKILLRKNGYNVSKNPVKKIDMSGIISYLEEIKKEYEL